MKRFRLCKVFSESYFTERFHTDIIQKNVSEEIFTIISPLPPELSDNIFQVLPFFVNLSDTELTRSLTPNFSVSIYSSQFYKKKY